MNVPPGDLSLVSGAPEFNARLCMNCGSCTALCPLGLAIMPRQLFRHVLLGDRPRLLAERDAVFSCLLCRLCEENCPAGVHIAENVRELRHYLNRELHALGGA